MLACGVGEDGPRTEVFLISWFLDFWGVWGVVLFFCGGFVTGILLRRLWLLSLSLLLLLMASSMLVYICTSVGRGGGP